MENSELCIYLGVYFSRIHLYIKIVEHVI